MKNQTEAHSSLLIVYLSHGGGPLPILGEPGHKSLADFLRQLPDRLHRPKAILVVSAHWEEEIATLTSGEFPDLVYDYYGFPEEAYSIDYPAPGCPELAQDIASQLSSRGIQTRLDPERGYDHGHFIPLKLMYPAADIPTIQLSLLHNLSPAAHIQMGKALQELTTTDLLVIGSGFSFHNMRAFSFDGQSAPDPQNDAFQDWLIDVCTIESNAVRRERQLVEWVQAPSARYCHPREEHLLPLHFCMGLANKPGKLVFDNTILGKRSIAFLWS